MTKRAWAVTGSLIGVGALLIMSCGEDGPTAPHVSVATVDVTAQHSTLTAFGQTLQLTAVAKDAEGKALSGLSITWESSTPSVLAISDAGLVTAISNGHSVISATAERVTGKLSLEVSQLPAQLSLEIQPSGAVSGQPFATQPLVEVQDANGNLVERDYVTVARAGIASGGGLLIGNASATAVEGRIAFDDLGIAGKVGSRTLVFQPDAGSRALELRAATSAVFELTPGPADSVASVQGDGQTGLLDEPLADTLVVLVTDAVGDAASGEFAGWSVTAGGGAIEVVNAATDEHGLSRAVWTMGAQPGGNEAMVAVSGRGEATFTARGIYDPETRLTGVGSALTSAFEAPLANVYVHGDYAYVGGMSVGYNTSSNIGVRIVDLSNPASPRQVGRIPLRVRGPDENHTHGDAVSATINTGPFEGDVAIVLNGVPDSFPPDSFPEPYGIWDVTDPANPEFLSILEFSKATSGFDGGELGDKPRNARAVAGNYFFALYENDPRASTFQEGRHDYRLGVADISDPNNPVVVGNWEPSPSTPLLSLSVNEAGTRAYVAGPYPGGTSTGELHLYVLDIQNPSQPIQIGHHVLPAVVGELYSTPSTASTSDDELLIFADGSWEAPSTLHLLDISNPASITELSTVTFSDSEGTWVRERIWEVVIRGNIAYAACFSRGVVAIDISDPQSPLQAGSFVSPQQNAAWLADVALLGDDYVVTTTVWWSGMYVVSGPEP